ncbi:MAG: heavy-metal-associated domain-containing protein [Endomicrobium sp.]|nr:heavy-metal-associated domain-containing protein [Endomicrobium sp.]
MSCSHCKARVERALNLLQGVSATVNLESNCAEVVLSKEISDETLKKAVEAAGYAVGTITDL